MGWPRGLCSALISMLPLWWGSLGAGCLKCFLLPADDGDDDDDHGITASSEDELLSSSSFPGRTPTGEVLLISSQG